MGTPPTPPASLEGSNQESDSKRKKFAEAKGREREEAQKRKKKGKGSREHRHHQTRSIHLPRDQEGRRKMMSDALF